ncbi:MAG: class I SAM-dependent methyltransferase [Burkholderiales bacterium]|nr:class I SAM-dependent methyltransferase [Burkholderiales bacterium]
MLKPLFLASAFALASLPSHADEALLKAAVASGHRTVANVVRDAARNPVATLSFFGVKPTDTVVELSPGAGGWYTEILAPYLREKGQLIAAADDPASTTAFAARSAARFAAKLGAMGVYDKVKLAVFDAANGKLDFAPAGSVDKVLTFRNVHNWMPSGEDKTRAVFAAAFATLKSGGVLGVVEHRLPADRPFDPKAASGYVHQAYVVKMAESVGFRFDGSSEVNANPRDTANHEGGVWSLPPVLRHGAKDRDRYLAIGESDRMTLRFVKP